MVETLQVPGRDYTTALSHWQFPKKQKTSQQIAKDWWYSYKETGQIQKL